MNSITLDLDSSQVPLAKFKQAVTSFLEMIEEVSRTSSEEKLKWTISVEKGSALVIASCNQPAAKCVTVALPAALKSLERGTNELPQGFSERAAKLARKLANVKGRGDNIIPITIRSGRTSTDLSSRTTATVDDLIEASHQSFGSLEGKLYLLSDHNGFRFKIHQQLFKRDITCFVEDDEVENALGAFRKRVSVFGRIQYNRFSKPISIKVSKMSVFPSNDELPTLKEIRGLLA